MHVPANEVLLDEPWVTISWDRARSCVHIEWKAFANSAEYRAALGTALSAIKLKQALAIISDTRKVKLIAPGDQKWVNDVWMPRAVGAGLERVAVVIAASGLGKMTVEETVRMIKDKHVLLRTFDSLEAGLTWLAESSVPARGAE